MLIDTTHKNSFENSRPVTHMQNCDVTSKTGKFPSLKKKKTKEKKKENKHKQTKKWKKRLLYLISMRYTWIVNTTSQVET